jgi:hypothetical protein
MDFHPVKWEVRNKEPVGISCGWKAKAPRKQKATHSCFVVTISIVP